MKTDTEHFLMTPKPSIKKKYAICQLRQVIAL